MLIVYLLLSFICGIAVTCYIIALINADIIFEKSKEQKPTFKKFSKRI